MLLVQDDHVIQQLPSSAADPSLGNSVLPRASKGRPARLASDMSDRLSSRTVRKVSRPELSLFNIQDPSYAALRRSRE